MSNNEGYVELKEGVFINYEICDFGKRHCSEASLECTFHDVQQMREDADFLDDLGLDDDVSFKRYIDNLIYQGKV